MLNYLNNNKTAREKLVHDKIKVSKLDLVNFGKIGERSRKRYI